MLGYDGICQTPCARMTLVIRMKGLGTNDKARCEWNYIQAAG